MSAPNFTITGPPLPLHETRTSTRTPGEEYNRLTPEQQLNIDEQRTNEEDQVAATKAQIAREQKIAGVQAELAQTQADEMGRQQALKEKLAADADRGVQTWKNRLEGAYQAALKAPTPSLWADKKTGGDVMRTLGVTFLAALADAGSVSAGGKGGALDSIIEGDLTRQRENIQQLNDRVVMARTGVKDAQEARQIMLAEVDAKAAGIYQRLEKIGAARLAALKVDPTAIANDPRIAAIREKGIEKRQQSVAGLYDRFARPTTDVENVTRDDPKGAHPDKPTERQSVDAFLGKQMLDELGTIDKLPMLSPKALAKLQDQGQQADAADNNTVLGSKLIGAAVTTGMRSLNMVPRTKYEGMTPNEQRVANALDALVDKYARKLTGAGMPETEAVRTATDLKPKAGDTPQLIRDKVERLRSAAQENLALSGPAAAMVQGIPRGGAPVPTDSTTAGGAVHGTRDLRGSPESQPSYSPAGPAVETKANNPDDPNSSEPLPNPPDGEELAPPISQKAHDKSGKSTADLPAVAPKPGAAPSLRERAIARLKADPVFRRTPGGRHVMQTQHITEADLNGR